MTPALTSAAKPASISASVAAACTTSSRPSVWAAVATDCRCWSAASVPERGLSNNPTTCADGTIAQRSSSRLPPRSPVKKLTPVALPGRFMLVTRPARTGSWPTTKTSGAVKARRLGRVCGRIAGRNHQRKRSADQIGGKRLATGHSRHLPSDTQWRHYDPRHSPSLRARGERHWCESRLHRASACSETQRAASRLLRAGRQRANGRHSQPCDELPPLHLRPARLPSEGRFDHSRRRSTSGRGVRVMRRISPEHRSANGRPGLAVGIAWINSIGNLSNCNDARVRFATVSICRRTRVSRTRLAESQIDQAGLRAVTIQELEFIITPSRRANLPSSCFRASTNRS